MPNLLALSSSNLMVKLGTNVGTFTSLNDTFSAKELSAFRPLWRAKSETIFCGYLSGVGGGSVLAPFCMSIFSGMIGDRDVD